VPTDDDVRRGSDRERPASAADHKPDAGRRDEPSIDVDRVLEDVRDACRRIRDALRDAWR
jgi:hypothetical protein